MFVVFFCSSRRRHTRLQGDWSSDVCSSDLQSEALFGAHMVPVAEAAPQILGLRLAAGRWPSTDPAALEAVVNRTLAASMRSEERRVGRGRRAGWGGYPGKVKERAKKRGGGD